MHSDFSGPSQKAPSLESTLAAQSSSLSSPRELQAAPSYSFERKNALSQDHLTPSRNYSTELPRPSRKSTPTQGLSSPVDSLELLMQSDKLTRGLSSPVDSLELQMQSDKLTRGASSPVDSLELLMQSDKLTRGFSSPVDSLELQMQSDKLTRGASSPVDSLELLMQSDKLTRGFSSPVDSLELQMQSDKLTRGASSPVDSLELLMQSDKLTRGFSSPVDSLELQMQSDKLTRGASSKPTRKVAFRQPSRPSLPRQWQIPSWQLKTTPSFKDLRNLLLSWKKLSETEKLTRSLSRKRIRDGAMKSSGVSRDKVIYSLDEGYMITMKSLNPSLHPNDKWLLAKLAKSHYDNGTLDNIIHPDLRWQMDSQSLIKFSYAAYCCLNEQRAQRPSIDRIISALEEALQLQLAYEQSLVLEVDSKGAPKEASSNLLKASTIQTTHIAGTIVYLDPEYQKTGTLKTKSDVYSFGVVLFEIMTGRLANDPVYTSHNARGLAPVVRQNFKKDETLEEMMDPNLKEESDEKAFVLSKGPNKESLRTFIKIGIQCLEETQAKRPTMKDVIKELDKALKLQENSEDSVRLSFEALKLGTQNFSFKIGHGNVYRGEILRANGSTTVAVKRWASNRDQENLDQENRDQEFLADLEILFEYKHENIIGLVGYCDEKNEKMTVYEYASNGSLNMHLNKASLTWTQRLKIGIEVALGLEFLHESGDAVVIHRDIKSSNILLNGDWKVKIGGFGLSVTDLWVDERHGTPGYIDPEHAKGKYLNKESDVYSFGVVLLEMMCGRIQDPDKNLVDLVKSHYEQGKVDELVFEGIKDQIAPKSLNAFIKIACECLHDEQAKRPKTSNVVLKLKEALELQEDIDIWEAKLPRDYKEIIGILKTPDEYNNMRNKDLYDKFSKGIVLPEGKVVKLEAYEKQPGSAKVMKSNSDYVEMTHELEDVEEKIDEQLSSQSKVNGKKCHMLAAKMILYDPSGVKSFNLKSLSKSRFKF
ncbi:hypothetical protein QVD17_14830 [Tagetes erecta]|uniref:Protein kinase domain-containing protein n=1 Tax=Tagetes erecta TaxID=13708 RepID=A0AAD8KS16_TARER|nr:hypothetical protein QVD17_14830 [Tagetes erecta]